VGSGFTRLLFIATSTSSTAFGTKQLKEWGSRLASVSNSVGDWRRLRSSKLLDTTSCSRVRASEGAASMALIFERSVSGFEPEERLGRTDAAGSDVATDMPPLPLPRRPRACPISPDTLSFAANGFSPMAKELILRPLAAIAIGFPIPIGFSPTAMSHSILMRRCAISRHAHSVAARQSCTLGSTVPRGASTLCPPFGWSLYAYTAGACCLFGWLVPK
jgi:hypothetical protein